MKRKIPMLLTGVLCAVFLFSACDYEPSEYSTDGSARDLLTEISEAFSHETETVITATVIDNINIRSGPGQDYELIERLSPGAVLTIVGEMENGYYPVEYNGETAYAHHNFLQINEPVVEEVDEPSSGDEIITVENNEAFAEVMSIPDEYDPRIGQFFNGAVGEIIEFDGYIAYFDYHGSYSTRYDVLVYAGDSGDPMTGPMFHFTDVSFVFDMRFDNNTPDMVGFDDEFRFTAEVLEYNEMTGLVELSPVSTVYRGN